MNLFEAAFNAPLMGVLKRWPHRLHAVEMERIVDGWDRGTFLSACGIHGMKLVGAAFDEGRTAAPWPPRLKGLPDGYVRCKACWVETGKKRPRCQWNTKASKTEPGRP